VTCVGHGLSTITCRMSSAVPLPRFNVSALCVVLLRPTAACQNDELVAVPVIIRMFVAPLPVFRLFAGLQAGEFPMCSVLSFLPGLVGTAFVLVPGMTIPMAAVVVSIIGAVMMTIPGLQAHGSEQGRTEQKRT